MRVRVITARELTADLRAAWAALQRGTASLGSPYFSPAYVEAAAAARDGVRIGVLEDGGRPAGFFPFEVGPFGIGGPVGGRLSDFHGLIAPAGVEFEPRQLVKDCGLRIWRFDHLVCGQSAFDRHLEVAAASPALDLSSGFERYRRWSPATSRSIDKVLRKARRLRREHGDFRFEFDSRDPEALDLVIQWKRAQCRRTGVADFLGARQNVGLLRAIHDIHTPDFAGILSVLRVGGRVAAAHFGMRSRDILHLWFPAYDPEFGRHSPGLILLVELARAAAAAGMTRLDLGKGPDPYKRDFCTHEELVGEGAVAASSLLASCRKWHAAGLHYLRTAPAAGPLRALHRWLRPRRPQPGRPCAPACPP